MKKNSILLACLIGALSYGQEKQDSIILPNEIQLNETIISGQYNPQGIKESIYDVIVINREMIDNQAGNTLADILNQHLNLNIIPSATSGKSTVQMFGLDAQYFKILVDNIPLVNDEGLGSNTDLTQINLDDIQQIEIVEGAMGVEYGANSIAGIINIITKKKSTHLFDISATVQEETISDEYNLNNKGRHIQNLKIGHQITDNIYSYFTFSRNDFKGYYNDKQGKNYSLNDGLRGYEWLPKTQNSAKAFLQYKKNDFSMFYKFEYFNEETKRYDSNLIMNENPATATTNPVANDKIYTTNRYYNHLNFNGKLKNAFNYDISVSFQEQKRKLKNYQYEILSGNEFDVLNTTYESRKIYYSKGLFTNFIKNKKYFDFQVGYEIDQTNGFASIYSGSYLSEPIDRKIGTYDVFGSAEYKFNPKFSVRGGSRVMFSEQFDTQYVFSLSAKYVLSENWEIRGILGTSPRIPNFDELYSYFVDVNHNVQGNANLNPERGTSAFLHIKHKTNFNTNSSIEQKLSLWKIDLRDKIELIVVDENPLRYQYENIDKYNVQGITYYNQLKLGQLTAGLGATITGVKQTIAEEYKTDNIDEKYFYAFQANANASYKFPKTNTVVSMFYKYNGPIERYVVKTDLTTQNQILGKGKQNAFSWFDASVKQSFFNNKLDLIIGARNLLDVKSVNTTAFDGGAHSTAGTSLLLGYGRSYFAKLTLNLSFN